MKIFLNQIIIKKNRNFSSQVLKFNDTVLQDIYTFLFKTTKIIDLSINTDKYINKKFYLFSLCFFKIVNETYYEEIPEIEKYMKNYNKVLQLQLFFFKSLLKDVELHKLFLKEHLNFDDNGYKKLIKKIEVIMFLQEQLMRTIKKKTRINFLTESDLLTEILVLYNQVNDLYNFYKPYHDPDNLVLCGINVCFTNPLYWYDKMIKSLKINL